MPMTCYRHPGRETGVSCSNCDRPICTDCMTPTPVGMRCPECSKQTTKVRHGVAAFTHQPTVTYVLIAINVLVFFASRSSSQAYEGALTALGVFDGRWWQLVTAGFLHAPGSFGFVHILFNMLLLWQLGGQILEPSLGPWKFLGVYVASLLCGSLGVMLLTDVNVPTVGASGAVFGLMGASAVFLRHRGVDVMQSGVGGTIVINLLFTFAFASSLNISVGGHVFGLVGGVLAGFLVVSLGRRRRSPLAPALACSALAVLAAAAAIGLANQRVGDLCREDGLSAQECRAQIDL